MHINISGVRDSGVAIFDRKKGFLYDFIFLFAFHCVTNNVNVRDDIGANKLTTINSPIHWKLE